MKVIIAGTRTFNDYGVVLQAIQDSKFQITTLVCGMADGVDLLGLRWAVENNVPVEEFYARWNELGRAAGHIRNEQMAKAAQGLILIWNGQSKGSRSMKSLAKKYGLEIFEVVVKQKEESQEASI